MDNPLALAPLKKIHLARSTVCMGSLGLPFRNRPGTSDVVLSLLLFLSILSCARPVPVSTPQPPSLGNDRRLLVDSLAHGELDLELLETCRESAVREELKSACQDALAQQQREKGTLQTWVIEWYGTTGDSQTQLREIKEEKRQLLKSLEPRSDLPLEFRMLLNIVSHDSEAVQQTAACVSEAYHPELKRFCQQAAELRRAQGRRMEARICQWYRDCISRAFPPYR